MNETLTLAPILTLALTLISIGAYNEGKPKSLVVHIKIYEEKILMDFMHM
jgi:hypothetical protein